MNIYLAGDSIVQNYDEEMFIAGWGQYLQEYIKDAKVINAALGGRSSRSFINEGRLGYIEDCLEMGDYLLIEFCHNDSYMGPDWQPLVSTPLGQADESGSYPYITGYLMPKDYIAKECLQHIYDSVAEPEGLVRNIRQEMMGYPEIAYYPYTEDARYGSYKWFLSQYIDIAKAKGAIPVLITAPTRLIFDQTGHIADVSENLGGDNHSYVRAFRQVASEYQVPILDLFDFSVSLFEKAGPEQSKEYMSISEGRNEGRWIGDFLEELKKTDTVIDTTHFNKNGARLLTEHLIQQIKESNDDRLSELKKHVK